MNTVLELLTRARAVSESHFKHSGRWSVWNQIGHAHSEVTEVYTALRKAVYGDDPISLKQAAELKLHLVDEIWDCVYSALTIAHILDITTDELLDGCEKTMRKIEGRVGIEG